MAQSKEYREKCFAAKPRECALCSSSEDILVHHIDGHRENNSLDNLMPVCQSCHRSIHHRGGRYQEWTDELPELAKIQTHVTDIRPREVEILRVLDSGESAPAEIHEETGLPPTTIKTGLTILSRRGYVRQVTRGLYEITEEGEAELDE